MSVPQQNTPQPDGAKKAKRNDQGPRSDEDRDAEDDRELQQIEAEIGELERVKRNMAQDDVSKCYGEKKPWSERKAKRTSIGTRRVSRGTANVNV